jgi:tetratricopeptide (TPR) repeat protein
LYAYRARLVLQHADLEVGGQVSPAQVIFESYDRAAALQNDRYEHYLGRAVARFRLPRRDLSQVLADLDAAIRLHPGSSQVASDAAAAPGENQELAQLHDARANVLEFMADGASSKERRDFLEKAQEEHLRAKDMDRQNPDYLVGLARVQRKLAAMVEPPSLDDLSAAQGLLEEAIAAAPNLHAAHNELGEIHLTRGKVSEARKAFQRAIEQAEQAGTNRGLYTYYCNLANACTRRPADSAVFSKALEAANQAIALDPTTRPDAYYYRALALQNLNRDRQALEALAKVLELNPNHLQGLLTQCQIIYEIEPAAGEEEIRKAYDNMSRVLRTAQLTREERAKANYVYSLAWLRYYVQQRTDDSLMKCQDYAFKAAKESPAYVAYAKQVFQHAATHGFQNPDLQAKSKKLQDELRGLATPASTSAN